MLRVRMLRVIMLRSSMPRARASLYAGTGRVRFDSLESLRHDFIDELLAVIVGLHQILPGQVRRGDQTPPQRLLALVRYGPVVLKY